MLKINENIKGHANIQTKFHCLNAYYELGYSKSQLANIFGKDKTTIKNWIEKFETTGDVHRVQQEIKAYQKFDHDKRKWLVDLYTKNPVLFVREAIHLFQIQFRMKISHTTILNVLREANMTRKCLERRAIQIQIEDVIRFSKELSNISWMFHNLVFLDEVSFDNEDMWRRRGYGIRGKTLFYRGEFSRKARMSLLCFCGVNGLIDCQITEGTFSRKIFADCLRRFIKNPANHVEQYPGSHCIFIMDGARIHLDENLTTYLRSLGLFVLFLPGYSPFFNPIEIIFGLMKRKFKSKYVENKKIDPKILVGQVANDFGNMCMRKLFQKCGYVGNGLFNPAKGMEQDLSFYGFQNEYGN